MATKQTDVTAMRDKAKQELDKAFADLETLQKKARGMVEANEERAALVVLIKEAKLIVADKSNEYGELARAASLIAGGRNFHPLR
jgi:hypothetical protein